MAGSVNAIGVHVKAPVIERNLSSLSYTKSASEHDAATIKPLVKFLHIYLLRVFGHVPNKYDSSTRLAGWITRGYVNTRFKLKAIFTSHVITD